MLKIVKFTQRFSAQYRTILCTDSVKWPIRREKFVRGFHSSVCCRTKDDDLNPKNDNPLKVTPIIASKYELFTEEKATVILDIEEERDKMLAGELEIEEVEDAAHNIYAGLNTEREYFLTFTINKYHK